MKKGALILQPMGGLANRMRVISVCYQIAIRAKADFKVVWAVNSELGAAFSDLFNEPNFEVNNVYGNYYQAYKSKKWYRRLLQNIWAFYNEYEVLTMQDVELISVDKSEMALAALHISWEQQLHNGKKLFISTGDWLGIVEDLSMFTPTNTIMSHVNQIAVGFSASTYGIHIRRTDNIWAIENSPLSLFENKIDAVLQTEPEAMFYLATDDRETIDYLRLRFPNRIIVRDKDFSRSSVLGIQDAVVDMWLLARTKGIYGSFYSSFSEMSSFIGGVNLCILRKSNQDC